MCPGSVRKSGLTEANGDKSEFTQVHKCVCVWPHLVGIDPVTVLGCQVGLHGLQRWIKGWVRNCIFNILVHRSLTWTQRSVRWVRHPWNTGRQERLSDGIYLPTDLSTHTGRIDSLLGIFHRIWMMMNVDDFFLTHGYVNAFTVNKLCFSTKS